MGLEVSRLVSHPRVASGVRLIEGVGSKFLPIGPNLIKHLRVVPIFLASLDKQGVHLVYNGFLLLTHGLTQRIALTTSESCKLTAKQHHLLLIDRDAISVLQIFLHAGNIILHQTRIMLPSNKIGNVIHRAWTIKRVHGDEVLKHSRMQLTKVFLHARRLKLERTDSASFLVQLVS